VSRRDVGRVPPHVIRGGGGPEVEGRHWLGIDIGGTFTDLSLFDRTAGTLTGLKVSSRCSPGRPRA
jgi:hypothetical protein